MDNIQALLDAAFVRNEIELLALHQAHWNEEDNFEKSENALYKLNKFQAAIILAFFIYLDSMNLGYNDLMVKYKYDKVKQCLGCIDISFDNILKDFYVLNPPTDGIGNMGIECSFEVEPEEIGCQICDCIVSPTILSCTDISMYKNLNSCIIHGCS